jgi:putative hemolysin
MELLILLLLVVLNAVFAMSEMSVVAARKSRLQRWADEGYDGAHTALALATEPGSFLSTIQIGVTLIGILAGAVGQAAFASSLTPLWAEMPLLGPYAETISLALVAVAVTVLFVILGELVPKRLALLNPEGVASRIAPAMELLARLTSPLVRALNAGTDCILGLLKGRTSLEPPVTKEEINILMQQGTEAGVFEQREQALVARIFRMDKQRITGLMTPRADIVYLDLNDPFETNRQKVLQSTHSRFPVCQGGLENVIGIVRAKALLDDTFEGKPIDFTQHINAPLFVPNSLTVTELLRAFKQHRQHLALIINEFGELDGLVTLNDALETLVGDVAMVEDVSEPDIVRRDDSSWLIDGNVTVQRFKEVVGLQRELPGEATASYHTLGGFAMMQLACIPQVGDRFEIYGWRFEIVDMDRNRVDKLLVTRPSRE